MRAKILVGRMLAVERDWLKQQKLGLLHSVFFAQPQGVSFQVLEALLHDSRNE